MVQILSGKEIPFDISKLEFEERQTSEALGFTTIPELMISPTKDEHDYDWQYLYIDDCEIVKSPIEMGLKEGQ